MRTFSKTNFLGVGRHLPEAVKELTLELNSTLHWYASTNCDDTHYLIYIIFEDNVRHIHQVNETWLDVSFLPECERYRFIVMARSDGIASQQAIIEYDMPLEPDANVTITQLVLTQLGATGVRLDWSVDDKFARCVNFFRVVRFDGESVPIDTYTSFYEHTFNNLVPCSSYEFTVTPIYNLYQVEGGIGVVWHESPALVAPAPQLESVRPGISYADITWRLPLYTTNRCLISSLVVDGSPYINLTIPIYDSPQRPIVPVHVSPLEPDRMYLFRVTMINSGGRSTPVQIAIQTQPETVN
ncbi:hypothetical protein NQ314_021351 [Rhamnusium bicolor]|uniref:Fibronectin type-III domain-containing protein n=1 Tax=Rhamnusium bicolor TaxID=1586634 RepID=A0AAV8WJN4_9CUCU|nr:hypothetical protein NQ314_021351 [Rhamnusium bicolor]